jgi:hypothetical protein
MQLLERADGYDSTRRVKGANPSSNFIGCTPVKSMPEAGDERPFS